MKYLKYFESNIEYKSELSQEELKEKLISINKFGKYLGKISGSNVSMGKFNSLIVFYINKLKIIFGTSFIQPWVSTKRIETMVKYYTKLISQNGLTKIVIEKHINLLYNISQSKRHDNKNIEVINELLYPLVDDNIIEVTEINKAYFENIKDEQGKLLPIFIIYYNKLEDIDINQYDKLLVRFNKKLEFCGLKLLNRKSGEIKIIQV